MAYNRINFLRKIGEIKRFAQQYYEPGRQDRNWRWVWRVHVHGRYFIGYRAFLRYMSIDVEQKLEQEIQRVERSSGATLFDKMKKNEENASFIDCGTNEALFLDLAAMRSDTDKGQYFIDERDGSMNLSEDDDIGLSALVYHKATATEIINHHKQKGENE